MFASEFKVSIHVPNKITLGEVSLTTKQTEIIQFYIYSFQIKACIEYGGHEVPDTIGKINNLA